MSLRSDGTLTMPVLIWIVRDGGDLYARSVNGRTAAWFRGTQVHHQGRIEAGGVAIDATFVDADPEINDARCRVPDKVPALCGQHH